MFKIYLETIPKERDNYNKNDCEVVRNPDFKVRIRTPVDFLLESSTSKYY